MRHIVYTVAALAAMLASEPAVAGWKPTSPSKSWLRPEPAGASDQMARMMQAAIQKNNLMKQPMVVSLRVALRVPKSRCT